MINPQLPLIDLHRHLDGSVRLQTILDLGRQHNLDLPAWDIESLRPHVQISGPTPDIMTFIAKFEWMIGVLVDYEACQRITYENILDAKEEGIDYIELRFSPLFMSQPHDLALEGIVEAVVAGLQQGMDETGVKANLIGILSRHYGPKLAMGELDALLSQRDSLVALDLAGDEANFPGELFDEHFRIARVAGWGITVHAGEAAGPENIWQAIQGLGATRIGHATRLMEDSKLVDFVRQHQIGIEVNLTSNVQTSTVPSYAAHPARQMLEEGLLVTINTDDPGISNIDLPYEFNVAAPKAGFSQSQVSQLQQNALNLAFLSQEEKAGLRTKEEVN